MSLFQKSFLFTSVAYMTVVNVGAFALFFYDKQCAKYNQWRIPEKTLCLSAALNGWIGGLIAMEMFRHKTKKQSFRNEYFMSMGIGIVWLVGLLAFSSPLRRSLLQQLRHMGVDVNRVYERNVPGNLRQQLDSVVKPMLREGGDAGAKRQLSGGQKNPHHFSGKNQSGNGKHHQHADKKRGRRDRL